MINRKILRRIFEKISPVYRTMRRIEKNLDRLALNQQMMFWWTMAKEGESIIETQKRVHAHLPKADGRLRELQLANLELLVIFKKLCIEHGMPFWLGGGTLLGAVRHKGYIPWDDDIDVYMLREDFIEFTKKIKGEKGIELKPYFTVYETLAYTTYKLIWTDKNLPYWIDIFPFDFIDTQSQDQATEIWNSIKYIRAKRDKKLRKAANRLSRLYYEEPISDKADKAAIQNVYNHYSNMLPHANKGDYIYQGIDTIRADYLACYPVDKLLPFSFVEFEGDVYPAPRDFDFWLKISYGDYWSLPKIIMPTHDVALLADKS